MIDMYRRRCWMVGLTGFLLVISRMVSATHIVGGELELRYLGTQSTYTHRINLNLYFDDVNGDQGADDGRVTVGIFSKRTNQLIGYVPLLRVSSQYVPYTNTTCQTAYLRTRLIRHSTDLTLDPNIFNDPGGYYLSWERCCRNGSIVNIQSPGDAGSTFYLEFPAIRNGQASVNNSSPVFAIPRGDYACIGQPFSLDFSAKDADGDSLTYTLVTPYNGFSTKGVPNPGALNQFNPPTFYAGPYSLISWITGVSVANEVPGTQPLRVNARTGLLTVTPNKTGLHVFSVEVVEYRQGKAIGRVRRDYQILVVDCPKNDPPRLLFRADGQKGFYAENTVITITEKDTNCLNLYVTDPNPNQRIQIINMSGSLPGLTLNPGQLLTRTAHDTLQAKFCFGECVGGDGKPFTLMIRATDEGCPQGLSDTLTIRLNVIPSPNGKPVASTNLANNLARVTVGSSLSFTAFGADPDNDNITIQAVGRGFNLAQAGMSFGSASGAGKVSQAFTWKPTCTDATRSAYLVDFIVTDTRCNRNLRDTVTVNLAAVGLPSRPPTVRTTLPQPVVDMLVGASDSTGSSTFTVIGDDADLDTIGLTAIGRGFDIKAAGMTFTNKTGKVMLQTPFGWKPTCELMAGRTEALFVVDFVADDRSCQPNHTDTTTVTFRLRDPSVNADIKVPNVFTPNNDGINDYFAVKDLPENACSEQFKTVVITNRYGRTVFTSSDPKFRWYGTDDPAGTYYYLLTTSKRTLKGPVTLIR
ncbi:gliding motility-associated C-terminal domain-containing protein [Spirosoma taeanense]|uniref:Gliding motility-associated C-terminal domain-containing protein n=1 Tax=Spirosoma taeanense TaxID=2735870 RepID=A0A6M5Y9L0_9BACT|nr:gliding motility-associated C-terminal domain-containing protein [Spirosoma taeanense]QJW89960.1 gliding motility-associated C-terminal domain-containing protein [Spirosoma taeanense]